MARWFEVHRVDEEGNTVEVYQGLNDDGDYGDLRCPGEDEACEILGLLQFKADQANEIFDPSEWVIVEVVSGEGEK